MTSPNNLPRHVAIIMDGNGRWADERSLPRMTGHQQGMKVAKRTVQIAVNLGIEAITLYAFSSENWSRSPQEIKWLMRLLKHAIEKEAKHFHAQQVRLSFIGRRDRLDPILVKMMTEIEQTTKANQAGHCVIAIDYGSRWEIAESVKQLTQACLDGKCSPDEITEQMIEQTLSTAELPPLDCVIRTSGECRMSNFLLWQSAYSELIFCQEYWPDFTESNFMECLNEYSKRQRRYGNSKTHNEQ